MTKHLVAIGLLLSLLWLASCAKVETPPRADPAVVVEPTARGVEPKAWQEQVQPGTMSSEPNSGEIQSAQVGQDDGAPADTTTTEARAEGGEQTDNIAPVQAGPVELSGSDGGGVTGAYNTRSTEPNSAGTAEPNELTRAPAAPKDVTTAVLPEEYAEILKTYVRGDGLIDYGALRRKRLDLKPLLMELAEIDPNVYQAWSRDEKLAFWINAYNLKMQDIVTRNYPIQSSWWLRLTWPPDDIRYIEGIWTDYKFIVMDEEFTLAEVERRFFRKTFDDPRVYLALAYASRSGPCLRREPYQGHDLARQLDEQVTQFLAGPRGLRIDRANRVVHLSALFKPSWRGKEFVSRYGTDKKFKNRDPETRAVLSFIAGYLSREDAYFLEVENYALEYMNFDWRLNDTSKSY